MSDSWRMLAPQVWARRGGRLYHDGQQWVASVRGHVWSLTEDDKREMCDDFADGEREALMGWIDSILDARAGAMGLNDA